MRLETRYAYEVINMLEDAQDMGFNHTVFLTHPINENLMPQHVKLFDRYGDAMQYLESAAKYHQPKGPGQGYSIKYMPIEKLIEQIKKDNLKTKQKDMNYNNLENLKEELSKLGFGKKVAEDMEKQIEKGISDFTLHDRVMGNKGQVDLNLHFKQSGQSENYYLNKYDVSLLNGKPLGEGEKYMVVNPEIKQGDKPVVRSFEQAADAISFFKLQSNDAVLAAGKDWAHKTELAKMEKGNVNYVEKDFNRTYRNPGISQTVFVERGKGFTAEQSVNLIQGRAVYRDDLLKLGGEPYKAWVKLDMDSQKDRWQNFQTLQYHVPTYGFDLEKTLDKFNIKELGDEKKRDQLIHLVQNGNRPVVTVTKGDQQSKLYMEVQPRYSQLNFFREDGKPEKREQFLKEPAKDQKLDLNKDKSQIKTPEQGIAV